MGTSTNAILCWGIPLPEEDRSPEFMGEHTNLDDWLDEKLGLHELEWAEREAARSAYPIDLVQHCSRDYPMWILIPRGAQMLASRGNPAMVSEETLPFPGDDAIERFARWCKEHNIEGEPGLYLCSNWC